MKMQNLGKRVSWNVKHDGILARWLFLILVSAALGLAGCSSDSVSSKNNNSIDTESDVAVEADTSSESDVKVEDADSSQSDVSTEDTSQEEDVSQDEDASSDADTSPEEDVLSEEDTSSEEDTGESEDVEEGDVQDEEDEDTGDSEDTGPAEEDPYEDRPMGKCITNLDCPIMAQGYRECGRSVPGGVCRGCGEGECGIMAACMFGTCQDVCDTKEDCAPGLTCSSQGVCAIERCQNNVCPTPLFGCSATGFCERIACADQSDCPELTTCTDGLCIENRQLANP